MAKTPMNKYRDDFNKAARGLGKTGNGTQRSVPKPAKPAKPKAPKAVKRTPANIRSGKAPMKPPSAAALRKARAKKR